LPVRPYVRLSLTGFSLEKSVTCIKLYIYGISGIKYEADRDGDKKNFVRPKLEEGQRAKT